MISASPGAAYRQLQQVASDRGGHGCEGDQRNEQPRALDEQPPSSTSRVSAPGSRRGRWRHGCAEGGRVAEVAAPVGQLAESRIIMDVAGMLMQLGVIPAPAA